MLYKMYGQTIVIEKKLKSEMAYVDDGDEAGLKKAFTSYLCDFFSYITIPMTEK